MKDLGKHWSLVTSEFYEIYFLEVFRRETEAGNQRSPAEDIEIQDTELARGGGGSVAQNNQRNRFTGDPSVQETLKETDTGSVVDPDPDP